MRSDKDPLPDLVASLNHSLSSQRQHAARALGRLGPLAVEALPALRQSLDDSDPQVREAAAQAIGQMGLVALPVLRMAIRHSDRHVRRQAVWALGRLGPAARSAVLDLCRALQDDDQRTRTGAAQALGAIGPEALPAIPALAEALKDNNMVLSRLAAKSLSLIGAAAIPTLLELLMHPDSFVRGEAALALGWMGPAAQEAVQALADVLYSEGSGEMLAINPREAVTATQATLIVPRSGMDDVAKVYAAQALGRIGPLARLALPSLIRASEDANPKVREAAIAALTQIRGRF